MLIPSEDRTLAFFESLILDPNNINELREGFFNGVKEAFLSTHFDNSDCNVIYAFDRDEYDEPVKVVNDFNDFLKRTLNNEIKIAKALISSKSAKILSSGTTNKNFFLFTENTLIELKKKSNNSDYRIIHNAILDLMFFFSKYDLYHNFSTEYLETLSVYRTKSKSTKTSLSLSFKWKEGNNRNQEIEFLHNQLISAKPPFINSSLETFKKAFSDRPLEDNEKIKWLCVSTKNNKVISQVTLVVLLDELSKLGYLVSDQNDFNKIVENIFTKPNGEKLKNIKVTKKEKSKNPSRISEIRDILQELQSIA